MVRFSAAVATWVALFSGVQASKIRSGKEGRALGGKKNKKMGKHGSSPAEQDALAEQDVPATPYKIALWGDLPYNGDSVDVFDPDNEYGPIFQDLRDTINSNNVVFSIHSGDVKSGGSSCGELNYKRFEDLVNSFNHPGVLSLGDNCWTDCHRLSNGNYNPLERLDYLRHRYYDHSGHTIFGAGSFKTKIADKDYPEIQMWEYGDVMYINGHVVGSNNGFYDGVAKDCDQYLDIMDPNCEHSTAEYKDRDAVMNDFVSEGFAKATQKGLAGVMVTIQANIFGGPCLADEGDCSIDAPVVISSGFQNFWENLVAEALDFGKPVILFHGDYHYYQLFPNPDDRASNLIAVQNPGSSDIGWVLCHVDPSSPEVFTFEHIDNTPITPGR